MFRLEFFFRTTQELEYLFFCRPKCEFFFKILTLGYMSNTLNQIIFFSSSKIRIFFFSNIGNQNIFLEKNHNPPFKLNGRSLRKNCWNELIWVTGHCNRAAVSRNRYGVEKTVDTHKILINAIIFYVCLQEM